MENNSTMKVYIAYAPCGCLAVASYEPRDEQLVWAVNRGYRIEVVDGPIDIGGDCPHTPKWGREAIPA